MIFQPVSRSASLVDTVVDQVQGLIADGHLGAGDRLPRESDLVEKLAVSRTVLREALGRAGLRLRLREATAWHARELWRPHVRAERERVDEHHRPARACLEVSNAVNQLLTHRAIVIEVGGPRFEVHPPLRGEG